MSSARTCKRRLDEGLKALRLPTMRGDFAEVAHRARTESLSYEQFLLELVESERDVRRQRRIERVLRASRLPLEKTLKSFDRKRLPRKVDAHVNVLLEGTFLDRCENVLAFGQPGSGKTHLLCAIGQELVYQGHRVLYRPCDLLVQELLAAKRDLDLPRTLKQLSRHDLLIIDDIAYVQHSREEMEVLFNLLAHRYQQPALFPVGTDLQRSHDHGGRHRPRGPPQRRPGAQHTELPAGRFQKTTCRVMIFIRLE